LRVNYEDNILFGAPHTLKNRGGVLRAMLGAMAVSLMLPVVFFTP